MDDNTIQLINALEHWGAEPKQVIDDSFMGDRLFYIQCLQDLVKENALQLLNDSLVPEKMDVAIRIVHTLKVNADYLGLFPVTDAAISVLTDLRNNQLEQGIADMMELENSFAAFKEIISQFCSSEE